MLALSGCNCFAALGFMSPASRGMLMTGFWLPKNVWYAAVDKAISAIYELHPAPEVVAVNMVKRSSCSAFGHVAGDDLQLDTDDIIVDIPATVSMRKLSRYLYVVSHVAVQQLLYIESCLKRILTAKIIDRKLRG
ncbi:hypothetical protein Droror1_Dr00027989 [Drosera rotundifolia]